MTPFIFWILAGLMLLFGVLVVLLQSPVASALSLVMSFICLAGLFVSLDAFFIAIIQVLVYAGAVMVLFLFIIMLLNIKTEKSRPFNVPGLLGGAGVATAFAFIVIKVIASFDAGNIAAPVLTEKTSDVHKVGMTLFTDFNLPLQVIGVLVLIATVGVIVLSKREVK